MNYSDTKTLYPNEEKSVGFDKESLEQLKDINKRLDNMSNDIADINDKVDGLNNQVVTENLQAAQASLQEVSANELSAQSASVPELEAGNATANKVVSRGEIKGAQLEISGTSHLKSDVTVDGKVTSSSVRAGSVTTDHLIADEMDVTDFTVDELDVTEKATIKEEEVETSVVTTQTVSSQTVEAQEVTSQNVVSQDVTSQEVTNQDVENAVIEDAEIKALTSGGNTFNFNSDNSIAVTEDSYIRVKPEINSEVRLILKTALNATVLAASVSVDVPAADKANIHLVYSNTEALSDIYFDTNGNLWLKLEIGVRGTLYFMQGGINAITPETDSVVNPAFDPTAEGTIHYESDTHGNIFITSKVIFNSEVQIDKDITLKKDAEIGGNVHIEGNLDVDGNITVGGLVSERAQYLGNSDYVTADDEGNFEAKDGAFDGDVTATGEISSTGDMTAGGDVNAVGDVTGTNAEFSGTVKSEGGFEGDLTGNVTGDLTGTAEKAVKDEDGNEIKTYYAKASDLDEKEDSFTPDSPLHMTTIDDERHLQFDDADYAKKTDLDDYYTKDEADKEFYKRGYTSVIRSSDVSAAEVVSILTNGYYTRDGNEIHVGVKPLWVGNFTINQDIVLNSLFDGLYGVGVSFTNPQTPDFLAAAGGITTFDFSGHKMSVSNVRLHLENLIIKNTILSQTSMALMYVYGYNASFIDFATYDSKEYYFYLNKCIYEDTANCVTDGYRYFRECYKSNITIRNKDDAVIQMTGAFDCDFCNFKLYTDKALADSYFIIEGLFQCVINMKTRYANYSSYISSGIEPGLSTLLFYTKTRSYQAKSCSIFVDASSATVPSSLPREDYIFNIKPAQNSSYDSDFNFADSFETISDSLIKVNYGNRDLTYNYVFAFSRSGVVNFCNNKIHIYSTSQSNYVSGLFYSPGNAVGIIGFRDNTFYLKLYSFGILKFWFSDNSGYKCYVYGFNNNSFILKSGDAAVYDPFADAMFVYEAFTPFILLPNSQDIAALTTPPTGYKTCFDSSSKYAFWQGGNSFNSY